MAAKPGSVPTWATNESNNTEPTAGQKATGWGLNQTAISSYFNWWMLLVYQWLLYLRDGDLSGDHAVAGALAIAEADVRHARRERTITPIGAESSNASFLTAGYLQNGAVNSSVLRVDLELGQHIMGLGFRGDGPSGTITVRLIRTVGTSTAQIGSVSAPMNGGGFANYTNTTLDSDVDSAAYSYYFTIEMDTPMQRIAHLILYYDRPAP